MSISNIVMAAIAFVALSSCGGSSGGGGNCAGELSCGPGVCCPQGSPYYCPSSMKCFSGNLASANAQCPGPTTFNGQPDNIISCM